MSRPPVSLVTAGMVASLVLLSACGNDNTTGPNTNRQYGSPVQVGNGNARAYVVTANGGQTAQELGIALDSAALDGLPSAQDEYSFLLTLPPNSPAPYQVVELDWNPRGHPPPAIYTLPHFDFHFYIIPLDQRNAIVPSDPNFAKEADSLPSGDFVPPGYVPLTGPGLTPADVAVPQMGVHWANVNAPELHGQTFTRTFIYGSWNGKFTFFEPMVSRDYLLTHPSNVTESVPVPKAYPASGEFPTSYSVTYDAVAKEYRVALTGFKAFTAKQ